MNQIELIDSHCHLDSSYGEKPPEELVRDARASGVSTLITIAVDEPSLDNARDLAAQYDGVYFTAGFHPHDANSLTPELLSRIKTYSSDPKCVAIGEIGLDYYYDHSPRDVQKSVLKQQLDLALEVDLPVVIHSRDAEDDLLPMLETYASQTAPSRPPGVIHCFSGTKAFAEACIAAGFYISFSGILTFKKAEEIREVAKITPESRILVETDSPYLAPVPHRGKKCEPKMVVHTAEKLAEIRGTQIEKIAEITRANTRNLFGLK